jgi:hypothetical protein
MKPLPTAASRTLQRTPPLLSAIILNHRGRKRRRLEQLGEQQPRLVLKHKVHVPYEQGNYRHVR